MGNLVPVDLACGLAPVSYLQARSGGGEGSLPTSLRHFCLRMAKRNRVIALSLLAAMATVLWMPARKRTDEV